MKKVLSLLLAVVMMFSLVACGGGEEAGSDVTTYKVGVAIYEFNDNFMTSYREELVKYFETKNTDTVKYEVTLVDGKNDMATQTDQIRNFITQGMDLIICNLVQTSSADAIIDEVVAAEIPLVLINREPLKYDANGVPMVEAYEGILDNPAVCYVGADARQSGTYQGEIVLELPDQGDIDGDGVIRYVMIVGDPENIDAQFRTEFSIKALKDAGKEVECLVEQVGNWATDQGQTIAANAITAHGDKIDVIFCNNDGMALGAKAAIDAAGLVVGEDLYLLGVDALPEVVELIEEGKMTGTVLNDHIAQSHAAVDAAVDVLAGGEMQNYYWANYAKIDKAYVDAQ
jgi:methyl-galactoside transport system substrate-binding protein